MKRMLMTSVAFSALLLGASVNGPAISTGFVTPAAAQDQEAPAAGEEAPAGEDGDAMEEEAPAPDEGDATEDAPGDSGQMTEEEDGEVPDDAGVDDGQVDDPDAPPSTTTGEDDTESMEESEAPAAEEEADEMMSDTEEDAAPADDAAAEDPAAEEDAMAAEEGSGEMFMQQQEEEEVSANTYVGQTLYNTADESIGDINDLIFTRDGGVNAAIVGVGGFLGIGQKNVAVNFEMIEIQDQPDSADVRLVIDATREDLEAAPEYVTLEDQIAEEQANQPATGTGAGTGTGGAVAPAPAPAQ